jgi:hypothetical protein
MSFGLVWENGAIDTQVCSLHKYTGISYIDTTGFNAVKIIQHPPSRKKLASPRTSWIHEC